jgi:hypothetical protein
MNGFWFRQVFEWLFRFPYEAFFGSHTFARFKIPSRSSFISPSRTIYSFTKVETEKTLNTKVVRNGEVKLLLEGNLKRSTMCEKLTTLVQKGPKRNTKPSLKHSTK